MTKNIFISVPLNCIFVDIACVVTVSLIINVVACPPCPTGAPLQQAFCHLKLFIYSGLMIQPFVPQCIALVCHELGQVNKCFLTVSLSKLSRSGF